VIRWSDRLRESSASGDLTAGHCRTFRCSSWCRAIPSTRCSRCTTLRGSTCTRGRQCRAGREIAWMSAMRSTSCIHWRGPTSKKRPHRKWQVEPAPMRASRAWHAARSRLHLRPGVVVDDEARDRVAREQARQGVAGEPARVLQLLRVDDEVAAGVGGDEADHHLARERPVLAADVADVLHVDADLLLDLARDAALER